MALKNGTKVAPSLEEQPPMLGNLAMTRIRLGIEKNLLSNHEGQSVPVVTASSGNSIMSARISRNQLMLYDSRTGTPVAAVICTVGKRFKIYSTRPVYLGQAHDFLKDNTPFYAFATVTTVGTASNVVMEGHVDPTYAIHKVVSHSSQTFPMKHVIKKHSKTVATTRYGQGNSFIVTIPTGSDPILMTCLAVIADEIQV